MHKICLLALLLFSSFLSFAQQQGKAELERERAAIQKEIDDVKRSLDETKRNKKASLAQLNAVQKKLQLRQREINVINQQMQLIEGDINQGWRDITKLKKELDTLKLQYGKSVVYSYKNRSNYDFLNFIFSASSFNDALKRVSYLKSYRAYREEQANNIVRTQDQIQGKITNLNQSRVQKSLVLKEEDKAKEKLEEEKREKDEVVSKLKNREKELLKDIADKKRQDLKLSAAITAAINRARMAAIAEAKKNAEITAKNNAAAAKNNTSTTAPAKSNNTVAAAPKRIEKESTFDADPAAKKLSDNFERNRGSLPWPIESGRISMRFGPSTIPNTHIYTDNKFLTFETEAGRAVKVIFDGEVSMVTYIGDVQAVIVRHGKYFSTYSNLSSVSVTKGQQVKTGTVIGRVAEKDDNMGELELGISNDANRSFDPEKWLR
ncbi:MAG TPA: peptidoglycan DD-metalloendopeptidase family protein [Chitinophagaceae bacterium]|nr:peptidoglycan DD-metalloendopeptidase family protein [Chitinophagaceae bacterium]